MFVGVYVSVGVCMCMCGCVCVCVWVCVCLRERDTALGQSAAVSKSHSAGRDVTRIHHTMTSKSCAKDQLDLYWWFTLSQVSRVSKGHRVLFLKTKQPSKSIMLLQFTYPDKRRFLTMLLNKSRILRYLRHRVRF